MIELLNDFTFLWLAFWALLALRSILKGYSHSVSILLITHFLFAGVPLLLDSLVGQPLYKQYPGFWLAIDDNRTAVIYCLYVSGISPIWWCFQSKKPSEELKFNQKFSRTRKKHSKNLNLLAALLLISPFLALLLSPEPEVYTVYGAIITEKFSVEAEAYQSFITLTSLLSVIGASAMIALQPRVKLISLLMILPWVILAIWLNGKRYIVALAIFILVYTLWQKGCLVGKKLILAIIFSAVLMTGFSHFYQFGVRSFSVNALTAERLYGNTRIDYGRDHTIKLAIFSELYPEKSQILEYRGESLIFYLTMYVPRSLWDEKPYPYAQYLTSAAFNQPPKVWGWGFTTSCLDESIANFSWFGLVIGPLIPLLICRIGDSSQLGITKSLTPLIASLLLAVQLAAFTPLFLLWLFLIGLESIRK